jgi:hypothetical protein
MSSPKAAPDINLLFLRLGLPRVSLSYERTPVPATPAQAQKINAKISDLVEDQQYIPSGYAGRVALPRWLRAANDIAHEILELSPTERGKVSVERYKATIIDVIGTSIPSLIDFQIHYTDTHFTLRSLLATLHNSKIIDDVDIKLLVWRVLREKRDGPYENVAKMDLLANFVAVTTPNKPPDATPPVVGKKLHEYLTEWAGRIIDYKSKREDERASQRLQYLYQTVKVIGLVGTYSAQLGSSDWSEFNNKVRIALNSALREENVQMTFDHEFFASNSEPYVHSGIGGLLKELTSHQIFNFYQCDPEAVSNMGEWFRVVTEQRRWTMMVGLIFAKRFGITLPEGTIKTEIENSLTQTGENLKELGAAIEAATYALRGGLDIDKSLVVKSALRALKSGVSLTAECVPALFEPELLTAQSVFEALKNGSKRLDGIFGVALAHATQECLGTVLDMLESQNPEGVSTYNILAVIEKFELKDHDVARLRKIAQASIDAEIRMFG